jgi:hypothetical protein
VPPPPLLLLLEQAKISPATEANAPKNHTVFIRRSSLG